MNRREFLQSTAAVTAATASGAMLVASGEIARGVSPVELQDPRPLIDTNITLSRWPFRRLPLDDTPALVSKLRHYGVTRAWAGTFDALLQKDVGSANSRLAEECRRHGHGLLLPFGAVNPTLPDWEDEIRRCQEVHRMPGIRLHPNYHGYKLDDPRFARLLDLAAERGLIVQLAVLMEDERTKHPLVRVPHVDVTPLLSLLKSRPGLRVVLLNWSRGIFGSKLPGLAAAGQVFFEISAVEGVNGVANLLRQLPLDRILFGSDAPFLYFESAWLKLKESELSAASLRAICAGNSHRLVS